MSHWMQFNSVKLEPRIERVSKRLGVTRADLVRGLVFLGLANLEEGLDDDQDIARMVDDDLRLIITKEDEALPRDRLQARKLIARARQLAAKRATQ